MATYSLAVTGARPGSVPLAKVETIDDTYATLGGMQYAMRLGLAFVTQGQDGRLHNRKLDAERWTQATPILKTSP